MNVTFEGFCDLQVNGFAGVDFNHPGASSERLLSAFAAMRRTGVVRCLPTLITSSLETFAACAAPLSSWRGKDGAEAAVVGLHMEGPYINPEDGPRGAHPRAHVQLPSLEDFRRRQEAAAGGIRLVTLAPELPGALALIESLVADGICVAIGHSAATPDQIRDAITAGARLCTHLGNAAPRQLSRHDNMLYTQLAADALAASVIVDGHHVAPDLLRVIARSKGEARLVLVTDGTAASAAPPGAYTLGDIPIRRDELGTARRLGSGGSPGALAGSALTLDVAIGHLVRTCDVPLEAALACAGRVPAALLGLPPGPPVTGRWQADSSTLVITS